MKAVLLKESGGADQLYIGESQPPTPSSFEVVVKVYAAGINRADILQREGKYPAPKGAIEILGLEISGTISYLGNKVSNWKIGDEVFGLLSGGGYAQYASIHEDMLISRPANLTLSECAAIPEAFLTGYQALVTHAALQSEETVLIHAAGSGVGTAAIQIAKLIGARTIITASKAKHKTCFDLGADTCIDYRSQDFETMVNELTAGIGVNVILDFIAANYYQQNINSLAMDGRMVMLAFLGGIKVPEINLVPMLSKRLKIMGSTLRSRAQAYQINLTQSFVEFAYKGLETGSMKPIIDRVYHWEEIQEAHQYMEANLNTGKIVLEIGH